MINLLVMTLLLFGCASFHTNKKYAKEYRDSIQNKDCEKAQEIIPLEKDDTKYIRFYKTTLGYTASLSILPTTMILDLLLLGRCRYGCPQEDKQKELIEILFPTTTFSYEHTKDLRCPENSYYLQKFIEVVECYEKRDDLKSLEKSFSQISYLSKTYHSPATCIQVRDGQVIDHLQERIAKKLMHKL